MGSKWHHERIDEDNGDIRYECHEDTGVLGEGDFVKFEGHNAKRHCMIFMDALLRIEMMGTDPVRLTQDITPPQASGEAL